MRIFKFKGARGRQGGEKAQKGARIEELFVICERSLPLPKVDTLRVI